jgi:hypothetical protein
MSKVMEYVPLVTPAGNPVKFPGVITTPAVPENGVAVGRWMCETVVFPDKPLQDACKLTK